MLKKSGWKNSTSAWRAGLADPGLDSGFLAFGGAQVEQASPANHTAGYHVYFLDERGEAGENTLNTDTIGDFADCECFVRSWVTALKDDALKNLGSFLVTLTDFVVNSDRVAGLKSGQIGAVFLAFDKGYGVKNSAHGVSFSVAGEKNSPKGLQI
jgi:hypothetical protein